MSAAVRYRPTSTTGPLGRTFANLRDEGHPTVSGVLVWDDDGSFIVGYDDLYLPEERQAVAIAYARALIEAADDIAWHNCGDEVGRWRLLHSGPRS